MTEKKGLNSADKLVLDVTNSHITSLFEEELTDEEFDFTVKSIVYGLDYICSRRHKKFGKSNG